MMLRLSLIAAPLALTACMTDDRAMADRAEDRAEAAAEVSQRLQGFTPTRTRSCLPSRTTSGIRVYDDGTALIREAGTIYRQDLGPGCEAASRPSTTLVTDSNFGSMCSGNIARVVDASTGIFYGSCSLGDWTEYERVQ